MLVEKSFEQALPLVQILDSREFCVAPVENTPLAALVAASNSVTVAVDSSTNEYDYAMFSPSMAASATDNETHNQLFDETISFLSKTVLQHVSNAKNIVAPVVMTVADRIIARSQEELTSVKTYAIVPVYLPAPMGNEGFKDSVEKAQGGVYADPEKYLKLKSVFAPEAVMQMMLTGSSDYDEKLKEWYSSKGDTFFDKIWTAVFQDPETSTANESCGLVKLLEDKETGTDAALAVYLIARNLFENIPENTGLTLVEYKRIVSQYKDACAIRLKRAYESYIAQEQAGILAIENNEQAKEIKVNGATYSGYIQNGGKNEVILGAVVSGVIPYNVNVLKDNNQQFIEAWDRYMLVTVAENKNRAIIRFKEICLSAFLSDLANLTAFEQEFVLANPGHTQKCQEIANQIVDDLMVHEISKPYDVALKLVCNARFYYTDAEKILSTINKVSEENKAIDVREAALIATIEYLVDYITDQMKVS